MLLILWIRPTAIAYSIAQNAGWKNYLSLINMFCALNKCICKVSGLSYRRHKIRETEAQFWGFCDNFSAKIGQWAPTWWRSRNCPFKTFVSKCLNPNDVLYLQYLIVKRQSWIRIQWPSIIYTYEGRAFLEQLTIRRNGKIPKKVID